MVEPGLEKIQTWLTPKSCSIPLDHHLPGLLNFHKATLMLQEQLCEGLHSKFNVSDMRTDWYLSYPWPCTLSLTFSLNSFLTLAIFLVPVLHYSQLNWYSYSSFFSFSSQFQIIPKSCLLLSPMTLMDDIFVQYSLNTHDVPNYKRWVCSPGQGPGSNRKMENTVLSIYLYLLPEKVSSTVPHPSRGLLEVVMPLVEIQTLYTW